MLCYHDKTWCSFYEECGQGNGCSRALTDEVKEDASKCWDGKSWHIVTGKHIKIGRAHV